MAYQKMGGVEGLLERFLSRALQARETESRRQTAIKVMLVLVDIERNTRSGVLTLDDIHQRMAGTVEKSNIQESVEWLNRSDVRLVTSSQRNGTPVYELAHERLIPALRRLAGKSLTLADQADQLLDRRVNEWLGDNRSSRYLLTWREWRLIQRQKPYLVWGAQKSQKEALLSRSRSRFQLLFAVFSFFAMLIIFSLVWLNSPGGQIWQMKRELFNLSKKHNDPDKLTQLAETYAEIADIKQAGNFLAQALQVVDGRIDDSYKALILNLLAECAVKISDTKQAGDLLAQALQVTEGITDAFEKGKILSYRAKVLSTIAVSALKMGDTRKSGDLLTQALKVAEGITVDGCKAYALLTIAESAVKIGETSKVVDLLAQARTFAKRIDAADDKVYAFLEIAKCAVKIADTKQAVDLLAQALKVAKRITGDENKAKALSGIGKCAVKIADSKQAVDLLIPVLKVAEGRTDDSYKAGILSVLAECAARISDTKQAVDLLAQALKVAKRITDDKDKAKALIGIGECAVKIADSKRTGDLLAQALKVAEGITDDDSKANALLEIAECAVKISDTKQAGDLLTQTLKVAEGIAEADLMRGYVLSRIAEGTAKKGNWKLARRVVSLIDNDTDKTYALAAILKAWAKRKTKSTHEKTKGEETETEETEDVE